MDQETNVIHSSTHPCFGLIMIVSGIVQNLVSVLISSLNFSCCLLPIGVRLNHFRSLSLLTCLGKQLDGNKIRVSKLSFDSCGRSLLKASLRICALFLMGYAC